MRNRRALVLLIVCMSALVFTACGGGSDRGPDISGGEVVETTNALNSPAEVDLLIDQAIFDANIMPNYAYVHPALEIHVMDAEGHLIGCVGEIQQPFMNYMGDAIVTYAEISGRFVFSAGTLPDGTEALTFRLVEKASHGNDTSCPNAYVGLTRSENSYPDYVLATTEGTIEGILANGLDFPDYGIFYMRRAADVPKTVELSPDVEGGQLALDQLRINEFVTGAGETSNPEMALYVLEYGSLDVTACAELVDVDAGSILFGTLAYGFTDQSGDAVVLNDVDPSKDYWFFLAERDTGDICPTDISGKVVLAYTGAVSGANFLTTPINFENDYGTFDLYTK